MGKLDVANEMIIERWVGELGDWLWYIVTRCLDWDVVVLLEVDTSLLLSWVIEDTKELALETCVGRTSDVLALGPASVSTASVGRGWSTRSTAGAGIAVCIWVEASTRSTIASWSEVRSACPVSTLAGSCVSRKTITSVKALAAKTSYSSAAE